MTDTPSDLAPDTLASDAPKVSVVCAWYNRADYIRETVDSILSQEFDSFEMVVVNDGSPDPRVREILDSYDDPRLRVIHQENRGFTTAIRRAVAESRGEFIAVQGAGDVSYPARLSVQVRFLENDPDCVAAGVGRRNVTVGGRKDGQKRTIVPPKPRVTHEELLNSGSSPFSHGEVMFRRAVYDRTTGYRPFFVMAQDKDLWLRMSRFGFLGNSQDVLYERRTFASDGIASRVDKTLVQMCYGEIAKQCAVESEQWGVDIVDLFGNDAAMFLAPSSHSANAKAKAALKYMKIGQYADGDLLATLALREKLTLRSGLAGLAARVCRSGTGRALFSRLIGRVPMIERREFSSILPQKNAHQK